MNYFRKRRLKARFKEGYSIEELYLMYRDWLPENQFKAYRTLMKVIYAG